MDRREVLFLVLDAEPIEFSTPRGDKRRMAIYRGDALIGTKGPPSEGLRTGRLPCGHIPRRRADRRIRPRRKDRHR